MFHLPRTSVGNTLEHYISVSKNTWMGHEKKVIYDLRLNAGRLLKLGLLNKRKSTQMLFSQELQVCFNWLC